MIKGYVPSVLPWLFGGYVHGPQVTRTLRGPRSPVLGPLFIGGKCSKPKSPVGVVPNVQNGKKRVADGERNAESENKAKTEKETNKPQARVKKARPVKRFSHFHGVRK